MSKTRSSKRFYLIDTFLDGWDVCKSTDARALVLASIEITEEEYDILREIL